MNKTADPQATEFLPASRLPQEEILRQHELVMGLPLVGAFLDASLGLVAVLNPQRQAIYLNEAFRQFLGRTHPRFGLGLRVGEFLCCAHAEEGPNGCGTTEACRLCGVAIAQRDVLAGERRSMQDCRIEGVGAGRDLNLRACATKLRALGLDLIVMAALDVSAEMRRRALERIFFHDVMNTAGGIQGLAEVMAESNPELVVGEYVPLVRHASSRLIDEISSQRDLASAETGELKIKPVETSSRALLRELARLFKTHPVAAGKKVVCEDGEDIPLVTDRLLLSRVLVNAIKNALEAETQGATITLSSRRVGDRVEFSVRNATPMPRAVQLQVFQKSFSTKGEGRGLGTYSIRLLTERYLDGTVSFISEPGAGTCFRVEYPLAPRH